MHFSSNMQTRLYGQIYLPLVLPLDDANRGGGSDVGGGLANPGICLLDESPALLPSDAFLNVELDSSVLLFRCLLANCP